MLFFKKEKKCKHDFEYVGDSESTSLIIKKICENNKWVFHRNRRGWIGRHHIHIKNFNLVINEPHQWLRNKVCLKCGDCINEIKDYYDMIEEDIKERVKEREKKEKDRKARQKLALKIWENCEKNS
jgi:hypothetical protein